MGSKKRTSKHRLPIEPKRHHQSLWTGPYHIRTKLCELFEPGAGHATTISNAYSIRIRTSGGEDELTGKDWHRQIRERDYVCPLVIAARVCGRENRTTSGCNRSAR